mgnify:CR=1 FL=1
MRSRKGPNGRQAISDTIATSSAAAASAATWSARRRSSSARERACSSAARVLSSCARASASVPSRPLAVLTYRRSCRSSHLPVFFFFSLSQSAYRSLAFLRSSACLAAEAACSASSAHRAIALSVFSAASRALIRAKRTSRALSDSDSAAECCCCCRRGGGGQGSRNGPASRGGRG